jgi:hypothetical protein
MTARATEGKLKRAARKSGRSNRRDRSGAHGFRRDGGAMAVFRRCEALDYAVLLSADVRFKQKHIVATFHHLASLRERRQPRLQGLEFFGRG